MAAATPATPTLLDTARRLLLDELLLAMPADKRHAALMIANAMAIADRQLGGDAPAADELAALAALLPVPPAAETDDRARLTTLNRMLCTFVREGWADRGATRGQVLELLWTVTQRKVERSNPKYLATMPPRDNR